MTTGDKIRDIKRPYRKKSLQTGYAQSGKAVVNHPVPYHSYATDTHQATQVVRPGVDPATYRRPVLPVSDAGLSGVPLDYSNYPWHMVSRVTPPTSFSDNRSLGRRLTLTTMTGLWLVPDFSPIPTSTPSSSTSLTFLERILGGTALGTAFSTR